MWYGAPKFHAGQQGFFMLHRLNIEKPKAKQGRKIPAKAAVDRSEVGTTGAYAALDPFDFQPSSEPGGVKTIIESESLKPKGKSD